MIHVEYNNTFLLFNKPYRWTSFDVVNKFVRLTKLKTGHAGTLDPLATGLLILCTGTHTKKIESFQLLEKEYTGTMMFGSTTPSFDLETEADEQFDFSFLTKEKLFEASKTFLGTKEQLPPAHSAKRIGGKRYFDYARAGKEFKILPHTVTLYSFEFTRIEFPEVDFKIVCGKGFYVRSLVNDFAKALGSGAHLTKLCRTRIGEYKLTAAMEVEAFQEKIIESEKV